MFVFFSLLNISSKFTHFKLYFSHVFYIHFSILKKKLNLFLFAYVQSTWQIITNCMFCFSFADNVFFYLHQNSSFINPSIYISKLRWFHQTRYGSFAKITSPRLCLYTNITCPLSLFSHSESLRFSLTIQATDFQYSYVQGTIALNCTCSCCLCV